MTIEQEARDIVFEMDLHGEGEIKSAIKGIAKALKAKQDRIDELSLRDVNIRENLILNLDEDMSKLRELSTEQLVCKAVTGIFWRDKDIKNLNKRIQDLENELRAYDLDIYGADGAKEISNMRKRIETLESALRECNGWLKEVEESGIRYVCIGAKSQREQLEKALGGGA